MKSARAAQLLSSGPLAPSGHRDPLLNQQGAEVGLDALGVGLELAARLLGTQPPPPAKHENAGRPRQGRVEVGRKRGSVLHIQCTAQV